MSIFALKGLIIQWSLALWKGLMLGCLDAILKRNGHNSQVSELLFIRLRRIG